MTEVQKTRSAGAMAAWAHRPGDAQFNDIAELVDYTEKLRRNSYIKDSAVEFLDVVPGGQSMEPGADPLLLKHPDGNTARLNNTSFGQFCGLVGARAGEYKKLPAAIAAIPLSYLASRADRADTKILYYADPEKETATPIVRALNSPSYGRIWNHELAKAVQDYIDPETWTVPKATAFHLKTGFITANDRKAFVFMVDEKHPIEMPGSDKPMYRGFYAWNSEVGDGAAGIAEFLFFSACANRAITGLSEFEELYIRHTSGAPDRWLKDAAPKLKEYVNSGSEGIQRKLLAAKEKAPAKTEKSALEWLKSKGFTNAAAMETVELARDPVLSGADERSSPYSYFNLMMGATARARTVSNNDDKVELERVAGKFIADVG